MAEVRAAGLRRGPLRTATVAMFDLADSTRLKVELGHTEGSGIALDFNLLCGMVTESRGGTLVRYMGDGALALFTDGVSACRAAVEVRDGAATLGRMTARVAITFGHVEQVALGGAEDVYGDTVDRCARLLTLAGPGQILIDGVLYEIVRSVLADDRDFVVGDRWSVALKGTGPVAVHELSVKGWRLGPTPKLAHMPQLHEEGRLTVAEKAALIDGARKEIVEMGTGLTTFADSLVSRRPAEFRDHVVTAMRRGASLKCLILDPEWEGSQPYLTASGEVSYRDEIRRALHVLRAQSEQLTVQAGRGSFEIYLYRCPPTYHASVADGADPRDGRMTFGAYLFGVPRSQCPVLQLSRLSNPTMFDTCWRSVQAFLEAGRRVWPPN